MTRVSALLLLVVVTRLINQEEYGLLTLVVTVGEMTDIAVTNWLRIALLRLGGKGDVSRGSLLLAAKVLLGSTVLALAIAAAASVIVVPVRWQEFATAVCVYLVVGSIARFALTVLQMQQCHSAYSLLECLRALLQLVLPIGAILVFPDSFLVVSLGSSAGMLVAGLAALAVASRGVVAGPSRFTAHELFVLGIPLVVMALVGFGLSNAERLFLNAFHDAGAVAIFAAAYVLARQPIDMVGNAINVGAFPEVMSRFDERGPAASAELLAQMMALMMRFCLPIAAMLVALNGPITEFLLPESYHGRVGLLFSVIAFSVLCSNLTSFVYGAVIHAHKRPWLLIIADLLGSIATITLSLLMIPPMAELGAALALAGGSITALAACAVISERLTPIPVLWRDIAVSLVASFATGAAAGVTAFLLRDVPVLIPLIAGGAAGAAMFLLMTWLFHPDAVRQFLATALRRYARS
ncbi:lipopolysaccharide biosynthesis protein [Mesorhizobium sp. BAC0120]|uniref:lipopolysaccharide biosynthesis protein n=1 Tax=Mesorhizobium sp. BAC0120 TaxID=3090670 RepID=UPI00298C0139|nr:polysaccharide biosynthesis C-terminal domain-containing protein [Mesorhizobium sp. BAC0120]